MKLNEARFEEHELTKGRDLAFTGAKQQLAAFLGITEEELLNTYPELQTEGTIKFTDNEINGFSAIKISGNKPQYWWFHINATTKKRMSRTG